MEVGGSIDTTEGVTARLVEIGKRGEVRGPIRADEVLLGKDARVETIYGKRVILRTGALAENVYGEDVSIESDCRVRGETQYTNELKVNGNVSFGQSPRKVDKLP